MHGRVNSLDDFDNKKMIFVNFADFQDRGVPLGE
jgi:hypothetical protein